MREKTHILPKLIQCMALKKKRVGFGDTERLSSVKGKKGMKNTMEEWKEIISR